MVSAWDENAEARKKAEAAGVTLDDPQRRDWGDVAALVLSPGIPLTHPAPHRVVELAHGVGAPVIGDVELFALALDALPAQERPKVAAITGTNGKSTTTALLGHILKSAGRDARVGGNIGDAVLGLTPPQRGAIYVLELSSYQLDLTFSLRCDAAALLNIAADHLDRHGGMEGYVAAKTRIFDNQASGDAAVIGVDDPYAQAVCTRLMAANSRRVIPVSARKVLGRGVYAIGGALYDALDGAQSKALTLAEAPALPGRHNAQNIACAYAMAAALGVAGRTAAEAIRSFPGLPHRLELAGREGPVRFINDSKATNADAAAQALACYDDIYWIAGGLPKSGGIASLSGFFPRIARAYLIGHAAKDFAKTLNGKADHVIAGDLETAFGMAANDALREGRRAPVVLLSPACASFDQFRDFEHRGDVFRALARTRAAAAADGAA